MSWIDPYFLTNKYVVYQLWIEATRKRLLQLNHYRPGEAQDVIALERKLHIEAAKAESEKYIGQSNQQKTNSDNAVKKQSIETGAMSEAALKYSTEEVKKANENHLAAVKKIKENLVLDRLKKEKDINAEISRQKQPLNVGEEGNPQPGSLAIEAQPVPAYLDYNLIVNKTYSSSSNAPGIFPQAGATVTTAITDSILAPGRFKYNFFSGGQDVEEYRGSVEIPGYKLAATSKTALNKLNKVQPAVADKTKFYGTREVEMSEYSKEVLKNSKIVTPTGTYKFFIEKLHGRHYSNGAAVPYKINPIDDKQSKIYDPNGNNFSNRKVFAAFIDNYNDSYSTERSSYSFIGRGEKVFAYANTERKITMEFTVLTDHAIENLAAIDQINNRLKTASEDDVLSFLLNEDTIHWGRGTYNHDAKARLAGGTSTFYDTAETTWQKINFLAQCMYPYYRTDGKMKEQPTVRIRIADFYDVVCHINNMSINLSPFDVPYIDFNNSSLGEQPVGYKVTLDATIIHDYEPSSEFYGFYHRKQFDAKDSEAAYNAKVWGIGLSKNADPLAKVLAKKSPVSIKDVLNSKNLTDLLSTTDFQEIENDIRTFKQNFKDLEKAPVNLIERVRKIKLKNIFDAVKAIQGRKDFFDALVQINESLGANQIPGIDSVQNKLDTTVASVNAAKDMATNQVKEITSKIENVQTEIDKNANPASAISNLSQAANTPQSLGDIFSKFKKI